MDSIPFDNVLALLAETEDSLIPRAIQKIFARRGVPPRGLAESTERMRGRMAKIDTTEQLRVWLTTRASLRSWGALHHAFGRAFSLLANASPGDPAALALAARIVACPTPRNVAQAVLTLPVA
jgi:hypothetical protein